MEIKTCTYIILCPSHNIPKFAYYIPLSYASKIGSYNVNNIKPIFYQDESINKSILINLTGICNSPYNHDYDSVL